MAHRGRMELSQRGHGHEAVAVLAGLATLFLVVGLIQVFRTPTRRGPPKVLSAEMREFLRLIDWGVATKMLLIFLLGLGLLLLVIRWLL